MFQAFEEEWSLAASWPPAFRGESHSLVDVSCRQTSLLRSARAVKMTEIGVPSLFDVRTYVAEYPEYLPHWALCPTHRPATTFQFLATTYVTSTLFEFLVLTQEMSRERMGWKSHKGQLLACSSNTSCRLRFGSPWHTPADLVGDVHTKVGTGSRFARSGCKYGILASGSRRNMQSGHLAVPVDQYLSMKIPTSCSTDHYQRDSFLEIPNSAAAADYVRGPTLTRTT